MSLNLLFLLLKDRALFHDLESYSSEYPLRPPIGHLCHLYIIFIFLSSTTYQWTYRPYSGKNPLSRYDHITVEKFQLPARICTSIEVAYISLPFWWPQILAYLSPDPFIYGHRSLKADKTVWVACHYLQIGTFIKLIIILTSSYSWTTLYCVQCEIDAFLTTSFVANLA